MKRNQAGKRAWIGMALAIALLALSLVLVTSRARAQSGSIAGAVTYLGAADPGTYHLDVDIFAALDQPPVAGIDLVAAGTYHIANIADGDYYHRFQK